MNNPALRFLIFILAQGLTALALHPLWLAILDGAGVSRTDVWEKRKNNYSPSRYILHKSKNPQKTKRLLRIYNGAMLPPLLLMAMAFIDFLAKSFDTILKWAAIILPFYIILCAIFSLIYRKKSGGKTTQKPIKEDFKKYKNEFYDEEVKKHLEMYGGNKTKMVIASVLKVTVFVGILVGVFFLIVHFTAGSYDKTVADISAARDSLISHGCEVSDMTTQYAAAWGSEAQLQEIIVTEEDDVEAMYAVFAEENGANTLWSYYSDLMLSHTDGMEDHRENITNYRIYTLQGSEKYEALVQVENTVFYASSSAEKSYIIRETLMDMGYYFRQ